MFERLSWLLVAAIVVSPVKVDIRHGFTWSDASAQYLQCDPLVLNYYSFNRYVGTQVIPRTPPPNCVAPTCVLRGACICEVRLDAGLQTQSKLNPEGCLLRICTYGLPRRSETHGASLGLAFPRVGCSALCSALSLCRT
jgi:hypothetical protein